MALLDTARFDLPLLATGQAHKELFHNEALARIDFLLHPAVEALAADPTTLEPEPGQAWLVAAEATDAWTGHEDDIAGWTGNGWLFLAPSARMRVYVASTDSVAVYRETWQLAAAIAGPDAGAVIDVEARSAIDSILAALEAQGIVLSGA